MRSLVTGLPLDLRFRTKGQLGIDVLGDAYADGLAFDFVCGDEVYGSCTKLREFLEDRGQASVLRVASSYLFALAPGTRMTSADVVKKHAKGSRGWEVRSVGQGSKGERWYAWAWIAAASPRHSLLVRRHLKTGELAFHYCYVPEGQAAAKARLIRAAGLRWPVEEVSSPGRAASAWTSARPGSTPRSCGTSCWSWPPSRSARSPPPSCGTAPVPRHRRPPASTTSARGPCLIPLTVHEVKRLLAATLLPSRATRPRRPLAPVATPPPGTIPIVPQTRTPGT